MSTGNARRWRLEAKAARENADSARALCRTLGTYIRCRDDYSRNLEAQNEDRDAFIAAMVVLVDGLKARIAELEAGAVKEMPRRRDPLPDTRRSETYTLRIGSREDGTSATLCLGFYDSGNLGEVFFRGDRNTRGAVGAFADAWATAFSFALQHGLSVAWMLGKARFLADGTGGVPFVRDNDGGLRPHPVLHHVSSMLDYCAAVIERRLAGKPATRMSAEEAARREAVA